MPVKLIDVSSAQIPSHINWDQVRDVGKIQGFWARCGEGLQSKDQSFQEHVKRGIDAGLRPGAYYVVAPSTKDPKGSAFQAMAWSQNLPKDDELPLMIDIERNRPLGADAPYWRDFVSAFEEHLDENYCYYTYTSFRTELLNAGFKANKPWIIAQYPTLFYPTFPAETLRKAIMAHMADFTAALKAKDSAKAAKAAQARARDAIALSKLLVEPHPVGSPPKDCAGWQYGGDANASTTQGVLGFCDRSFYYGDWTTFLRRPRLQVSLTETAVLTPVPILDKNCK